MSAILVTGGAGFIGNHLCKKLVQKGNVVYSLDNYFTGSVNNHYDHVTYINGSTENIFDLISFSPDVIYHLGEYSRVEQSFSDIKLVHKYNTLGTFQVLEFAKQHSCKIIYAASSTKFGNGGLGRNASPYAYTKASNVDLVKNYGTWYGLQYAITYFYNVYGPKEIGTGKYATVIGLFKEQYKKGLPLTIVSPGTQRRNFTHIEDIISALLLIQDCNYNEEFSIGSDESLSILEVAKMFNENILMLPERQGNRMNSDIATDKLKSLGWFPKHKLKNYIDDFIRQQLT
jgi:UDP-glucose 4-epimerase